MRAQLCGTQPLMRASKVQSYGTRPSLHDSAGTYLCYVPLLVYNNILSLVIYWLFLLLNEILFLT